jgi:hypothetical protein
MVGKMCLLMPALAANDFEFFSIVNRDVVSQEMSEGDVVSTVESKLFPIQGPLQNVSQQFLALVSFFFIICHSCLLKNKSPATIEMTGLRVG